MNDSSTTNAKKSQSWIRRHPVWTTVLAILGILIILLVVISFLPFKVEDTSVSLPATSHEEAVARVEAIRAAEKASGDINPVCLSNLMTHGDKTEKVIIFYHGFTSCPEQFRELGEQFFAEGYNVYIPRMPHHGNADRMSEALLETSAEELAAFTTASVDIAQGLGDEITVAGLSGGGTLATWIAQEHEDVDQVVMVSPFLGVGFIPAIINRPLTQIVEHIPNIWMWWDPKTKEDNPFSQSYQYPRYPLHALAEYMRLGFAAQRDARDNKPGVNRIVVITNANDESVNNTIIAQFVKTWRAHGEEYMDTFEFEKDLNLPHDLITPTREDGNPAFVYPILIDHIIVKDQ